MPARSKYAGDQDPRYGGQTHWHPNYGIPFVGENPPTMLKPNELEQVEITTTTHMALFDLANADHLGYYTWVKERTNNYLFQVKFEQRFFDPNNCRILVYIEWTQPQLLPPPGGRNGA